MNLGLPEIIIIAAVALLVFGPKKLPELAKGLGKGIRDFKKALEGKEEDTLPPQANEKQPASEEKKS
jgi:sec-independent protein translocase protein TatA